VLWFGYVVSLCHRTRAKRFGGRMERSARETTHYYQGWKSLVIILLSDYVYCPVYMLL
jgi:hypothetical protein